MSYAGASSSSAKNSSSSLAASMPTCPFDLNDLSTASDSTGMPTTSQRRRAAKPLFNSCACGSPFPELTVASTRRWPLRPPRVASWAEELTGCTVLTVAHRGAALADWNLRVDMAWGRIRAVTKDRKQDDDEDDSAEGVAVGGGRENAMEALAKLAKE